MKRNVLWPLLALALLASLSADRRTAAQSPADADAATDAAAAADQAATDDASTSADAQAEADAAASSGAQPLTQAEVDAAAAAGRAGNEQPSTGQPPTGQAPTGQAPTGQPSDAQDPTTTAPSTPPAGQQPGQEGAQPDPNLGAQGQAGVDVRAGVNANQQLDAQARQRLGVQFGQPTERGLTINNVAATGFFRDAGIRRGDVLVSFNGRPIRSQAEFFRWVAYRPGQRVPVVILRDGRPQTVYVVYRAVNVPNRPYPEQPADYTTNVGRAYLGVTFDPTDPDSAVVRTVHPGSPAEQAGLRAGDLIVALNGRRVYQTQEAIAIVASLRPGDPLDIDFARRVDDRAQAILAGRPVPVPQAAYGAEVGVQYAEPPVPATAEVGVYEEARVAPAPVVPVPARPRDFDGDGRVIDRDRIDRDRAILPRRRN